MKKGDVLESVLVESMAAEGRCVSKLPDGRVLFVEGAAPGDVANIQLTRIKSNFLEGRATQIISYSSYRQQPFCEHVGLCGGCKWQHLHYQHQLQFKHQQVIDNLERIGGVDTSSIKPILPSATTQFYRNKLDYTFSSHRWLTREELHAKKQAQADPSVLLPATTLSSEVALGYHLPSHYDKVFDVHTCYLQPEPSNSIRLYVKQLALEKEIPFFDLRKQVGFLRTLTIRSANSGEMMVILQVTYDQPEWTHFILDKLHEKFPQITSLQYVINGKRNDTFHDLTIITYKGLPYITEEMDKPDGSGKLFFRVGPKSFYQTNAHQAFHLYKIAWEMAALSGNECVYDLYTGTGTIASFVAAHAKKVIGVEYVAAAIEDAKVNALLNNISNVSFFAGDMKDLLKEDFILQHGQPDVVITDPPRAGMHEDVCCVLLQAAPQRIVYVSCNPATQARDLKILSEKYIVTAIQPVDMFPHTTHVENVVRLDRIS